MGKVIADLATSAASATFAVENATSSVGYVLSGTDGSANHHLKTDGSGNLAWVAPPAGGLTRASQWRLTADLAVGNGTTWHDITANLSVATSYGYGSIGADFAAPTSGVFTFPETGTWLITFVGFYAASPGPGANPNQLELAISTTIDNAAYNNASEIASSETTAYKSGSTMCNFLFNVSSVSTHKVKFSVRKVDGTTSVTAYGDANKNETSMTFLRLGDST